MMLASSLTFVQQRPIGIKASVRAYHKRQVCRSVQGCYFKVDSTRPGDPASQSRSYPKHVTELNGTN